jgi:DNA gyrase subunit A
MKERINLVEITNELKTSYLDYALSVIISRALPDVRDGLKPVQRRILYTMKELGLWSKEKFTKSANIVGNTLARYHPHGDQAVYDALVRMAQDFSLRYPLILGQGNFGSIDGDPQAQMRYTEAKLSPFAEEMLADIDKDTVDFMPNYDNTRKEPVTLPSRIPQLVLNGALGIAVGMATNIPPHNLKETLTAVKEIIKNPNITIKEILSIIKGPDFPTGGLVYGKSSLLEAYKTGKGSIVIRGKTKIEKSKRGKERIIITEIPWQVNKSELVSQIANLAIQKIIPIKEVRDESNKEGIRIVIELKEGSPEKIIEKIYKLTDLQKKYYFNFIALEDGIQPRLFNIKDLLTQWIEYRKNVIIRRTRFDLEKAKDRIEILEGFKKALENIDAVIRIIRKSKDKESAKIALMKKLKINERQADAILEMPLRTLTNLERSKILDELKEKLKLKEELEKILKNPKKVDEIIIKDCDELIEKYGDERRTEIIGKELEEKEEEIPVEDILVFINDKKFVTTYKIDTPFEKIIKGEKEIGKIYLAKTTDKIIAYTKKGKFYQIPVKEFYNNPKYLEADIKLEKDDFIIDEFIPKNEKYLLIFTKNGISKKIKLEDALSVKRTGSQAIKLKKEDEVVKSFPMNEGNIFMITKNGFGLCIKDEFPLQGKNASGVKAIKIINDELFNASILNKNYILCIFSNGFFKKISIKEFNIQKRGGKGIKVFDKNEKFGELIFADLVNDDEELFIINEKLERIKVKDIPVIKRVNQPKKVKDKISKVYVFKI